jgi:uncharacterized coiled-coil DUF342 family protein
MAPQSSLPDLTALLHEMRQMRTEMNERMNKMRNEIWEMKKEVLELKSEIQEIKKNMSTKVVRKTNEVRNDILTRNTVDEERNAGDEAGHTNGIPKNEEGGFD